MSAGENKDPRMTVNVVKECFNEAPACLPGKTREASRHRKRELAASMRPRRVCRGKLLNLGEGDQYAIVLQ